MDNENMYELFLGIRTSDEEAPLSDMLAGVKADSKTNYSYEASEYSGLIKIFDYLTLLPHDTLVDFGCGMGRVLFYCNQRFMCNVTGIEYDKAVYGSLLENADSYHKRFKNQERKFLLLNMDANDYIIEKKDNFFYFFNPFSKDTLTSILKKIVESADCHHKKVTVILYYCTYNMMDCMRKTPFSLINIIKLSSYDSDPDEKVYIYEYSPTL